MVALTTFGANRPNMNFARWIIGKNKAHTMHIWVHPFFNFIMCVAYVVDNAWPLTATGTDV